MTEQELLEKTFYKDAYGLASRIIRELFPKVHPYGIIKLDAHRYNILSSKVDLSVRKPIPPDEMKKFIKESMSGFYQDRESDWTEELRHAGVKAVLRVHWYFTKTVDNPYGDVQSVQVQIDVEGH